MSTQANTSVPPATSATEIEQNGQDPTPAQAAGMQATKAGRKGKEPAAGRSVSDIAAEERRSRLYSPYHKRDKDGDEANGGDPSQGGSEHRRTRRSPSQTRGAQLADSPPPEIYLPPGTTPPPAPRPRTMQHHEAQQPLPRLLVPLPPQLTQLPQGNPAATQTTGQQAQDVVMEPAAGPEGRTATDQPENPHLRTTMANPLMTVPPRPGKGYAGGPFPKTVIDSGDLFKSIRPEILQNLLNDPQDFLLLLPYGAGRRLHAEFPNLGDDILEYLKEFRAPDCEGMTVVRAATDTVIKGKKPRMYKRDFDAPWVFILSGFSADLREFLLGVGVFDFTAGEANHAFTVLEVEENVRSWHVAYLTGDGVAGNQQTMEEGLTAIKKKLKDNVKVRASVLECYAGRTEPHLASTDDKVQDALSTLAITFTTEGSQRFWHLTAKPVTDDPVKHDNWLKALRDGKSFVLGRILAVDVSRGFERCDFCKNESHPEGACPFPKTQGWRGPRPSDVRARWAKADKKEEEGGQHVPERGQWGGRGRGNRDHNGDNNRGGRGGHRRQPNRGRPY
ncbi:hypothetical protein CCMSSC00406_0004665 [Pleurotus cornucopiae]|uniref:Uncharacterized protein n=1 Tax=Pleurotus cornucopiae TaxID=5321 RepID=A0ACB7IYM3_PLECO|nr:hypothetical protein CCMSSC00406_0004665 [Pleurotus cornucopiae]